MTHDVYLTEFIILKNAPKKAADIFLLLLLLNTFINFFCWMPTQAS